MGRITPIILLLLILGCAAAPPKPTLPPAPAKDSFSVFPERYRHLAVEHEKAGELPRALQDWKIVNSFEPADQEVIKKMDSLKTRMHALAREYFKKGVSYYENHSVATARKAFLLTLYYDPDNKEALSYLKSKLVEEDHTIHEVKPGDTLKGIAKKVYNDPQKDFLIAYFNNLGKNPQPSPKTTLRLPVLEGSPSGPEAPPSKREVAQSNVETEEMPMAPMALLVEPRGSENMKEKEGKVAKAAAYFKANKFRETASITDEILLTEPSNKEARDLRNASYYEMGKELRQQGKHEEALINFDRVDPGYRDVSQLVASEKRQLAEVHYIAGIKYFTEEKLDKAVSEWKETLKLNPEHPKAKGDMETALKLLETLKEIK